MSETNNRSGLFVGRNHGHIVKRAPTTWKSRPVTKKGQLSKRAKAVREIIREVAGFTPLEKKMMEMIRTGEAAKEKKAVKNARQKLGTHKRALHKRDELTRLIQAQNKASRDAQAAKK
jgi:large subunit ribosomal protein L36e